MLWHRKRVNGNANRFSYAYHSGKLPLILLKNMAVNAGPMLERTCTCGASIMVGGKNFRDVTDQVWSPEKRIADMDKEGVDIAQVLSPIPVTFSYWARRTH